MKRFCRHWPMAAGLVLTALGALPAAAQAPSEGKLAPLDIRPIYQVSPSPLSEHLNTIANRGPGDANAIADGFSSKDANSGQTSAPAPRADAGRDNKEQNSRELSKGCACKACAPTWEARRRACWADWKYHLQGWFLGYPEEFIPQPLGASLYAFGNAHVANGQEARLVLYHFDFVKGTDQLNTRGKDELAKMMCLLVKSPYPLIIQRTPETIGLDEARRISVLNEMAKNAVIIPAERVVVGPPIAVGLRGVEAEIMYQNLLFQTQSAGGRGPGGNGAPIFLGGSGSSGLNRGP